MRKLQVIVGGQAGSEGKGAIAGYLAQEASYPACIRVAGPNAGHSVVNPATGVKHALRQIPVGAVTNPDAFLGIAAGSEVDIEVLRDEIDRLEKDGVRVSGRLLIDPMATVLTPRHVDQEQGSGIVGRIGSTGKGIGAARADRIARTASLVRDFPGTFRQFGRIGDVARAAVARGRDVHVEGTQGYLLGLHHPNYPKVTSSDCAALDFLAMARVNPWMFQPDQLRVWVVFRPYPIRVAGDSGPLHDETSWEELGLEPELTTVTKKVRRVGQWHHEGAFEAVEANSWPWEHRYNTTNSSLFDPIRLALTMADQIDPGLHGAVDRQALLESDRYQQFLSKFVGATERPPHMVTTSDRTRIWARPES